MICVINLCQGVACQEYTKVKPPFLYYGEQDLYNNYILKDPDYIDRFVLTFLVTVSSNMFFRIPIRLTMWVHGRKLYNQPRNQGV